MVLQRQLLHTFPRKERVILLITNHSPPISICSSKKRRIVLVIALRFYIKRSYSPKWRSPMLFPLSIVSMILSSLRNCHVIILFSLSCENSGQTFTQKVQYPILCVNRNGNLKRMIDEWRRRNKRKLRGRSLAIDWRASAYPTSLITGRHSALRNSAPFRTPHHCISGTKLPRSSFVAC